MGTPAAVAGDRVMGTCVGHLIPGPGGAAVPGPPLPFSAPLLEGLATSVLIGGSPAAVVGSAGMNSLTPHAGLHAADPAFAPALQRASVVMGSTTVLAEGRGMAATGARAQLCLAPVGTVQGGVPTVLIGGGPGG
ncbi:PAAR domain-containing protein [Actinotalea sp. K2]|uniref:PAAR domain-containing protein n=1 Tax=Actinotalea sp. K2 TaxID=2939438 RepID=UPI002017CAB3|nr:PAAR domain-containing protein [Actinotalea sp. K2]MCL3860416.1 hypothetical protein [Actinotalea sp. K2]